MKMLGYVAAVLAAVAGIGFIVQDGFQAQDVWPFIAAANFVTLARYQ